jgi:tetratricopeptide (TPR) repeat protein
MLHSQEQVDDLLAVAAGHRRSGDLRSADAVYSSVLALNPRNAEAWHLRGLVAHQAGDATMAVQCVEQAVAIEPRQPIYWNNLGLFYRAVGRKDDAIASFRQAIDLQPDLAHARANLANALNEKGDFVAAEDECRLALRLQPDLAPAYNNLGVAMTGQQRHEEAIASYRRAIELDPNSIDAHRNLGHALRDQGAFEEARWQYEATVMLNPRETHALYGLSLIRRHRLSDPTDLLRLESRLRDPLLSVEERAELNFALGKICDDCGLHDQAFEHFRRANEALRPAWDRRACTQAVDALIEAFCPERIAQASPSGHPSEQPVFIVGMPRSGTTLVEQILASSPKVAVGGERADVQQMALELESESGPESPWPQRLFDMAPARLHALASRYLTGQLRRHPDALRTTDKMPTNFFQLGFIWRMFPNARIIHCLRDPRDVCLSCYFINFSTRLEFAYDLEDLAFCYNLHQRVMSHWRSVLPIRILPVQYEHLVTEPVSQTRRIVEFCGLDWEDRYLRFHENRNPVRTSSGWQVRQPMYATAIGRWRYYERHLGPLLRALATDGPR